MEPAPERAKRRFPRPFLIWAGAVVSIFILNGIDSVLDRVGFEAGPLTFFTFLAWVVAIALTLYGFAVATRWILRKLFWTVGRRLFLSYILIGVLPFFLFAVLLSAILYVIAGVASRASFNAERKASLGELEVINSDYALQGRSPRLPGVEVYDTAAATGKQAPRWLLERSFSGFALRGEQPLLVASRQYPDGRSVVVALPMNSDWSRRFEERAGMVVSARIAEKERDNFRVGGDKPDDNLDRFGERGFRWGRIVFFDITEEDGLMSWDSGQAAPNRRLFTAISNPVPNLLQFYFGGSTNSQIMRAIFGVIIGLATALMIAYLVASAFAAFLIFSISRAVNRIEKGTKAVERGDFSYRIGMKPRSQLGAMAQSFDRMTGSLASLLTTVAEKERLQSEIEIAATIQRNLLPKEGPLFGGVTFSAHFEPTASIGGDYYDVFNLDKSRLAVAIGDVSGHGLSTGLVMAMVKAAITTLVEEGADETSLFRRLNELVFRSTERRAFMTLAFTIFDLERGTLRHTNAGHLYPYILRAGTTDGPIPIECPSLPLGVREQTNPQTVEAELREGDTIVYLSDGIVEAQDVDGEPFGFDKMETLLREQVDLSPGAVRESILMAVAQHSGARPADDDRTIMVVRFETLLRTSGIEPPRVVLTDAPQS